MGILKDRVSRLLGTLAVIGAYLLCSQHHTDADDDGEDGDGVGHGGGDGSCGGGGGGDGRKAANIQACFAQQQPNMFMFIHLFLVSFRHDDADDDDDKEVFSTEAPPPL